MRPHHVRRVLFLVALIAIPFPYAVAEGGYVPAIWLATVAIAIALAALTQGGSASALIARYYLLEALAVVVGAYLLAHLGGWLVRRLVPAERQRALVVVLALVGVAVALLPIFSTTAVRAGAPQNLIGIFAPW
jgi:hypothetical protein